MTGSSLPADFWQDRPVGVTGAGGFLGSHLTAMLVELGALVVVVERDQVPETSVSARWQGRVTVVPGDTRDQALMERMLGEWGVATLFHLAAQTQVGTANRNPVSTFDSNVRGTWSVLEAARRSPRIEQVVVASSDKAYGDQPALPYTEDMPLLAVNPYDVSKACADRVTTSYAETFGLPASVVRCGNFFGPGDTNWERLVPGTIRDLLRGRRPVVRSDGSLTRDYVYVEDGALAYLALAEAMASRPGTVGQAFNFSNESPLSVLEVVDALRLAIGRLDLEPDVRADAPHEIAHQFLSAERARRVLGWKPQFTMEEGLGITIAWYRDLLLDG